MLFNDFWNFVNWVTIQGFYSKDMKLLTGPYEINKGITHKCNNNIKYFCHYVHRENGNNFQTSARIICALLESYTCICNIFHVDTMSCDTMNCGSIKTWLYRPDNLWVWYHTKYSFMFQKSESYKNKLEENELLRTSIRDSLFSMRSLMLHLT